MNTKVYAALAVTLLAVAAAIGAYWWVTRTPEPAAWQGWVEADMLFIGADEPGRVESLNVREGSTVKAGTLLFSVEAIIQTAEVKAAQAALDEVKAKLARAEASQQRPEEIAVLESALARAKAALAYSTTEFERAKTLAARGTVPQSRLDSARAALDRDRSSFEEAQRQIDVARLSARREDVEAAREAVAQAEARLASAKRRQAQREVFAPADGTIQEVYFRPGEIAPSGRPVVSLLPPGNIKVRFFVPQAMLPHLAIGEEVEVTCDGCPSGLTAHIIFISAEAEFTPPVIYSLEERAKLVFRIEARPKEPQALRVGQPVTVRTRAAGGAGAGQGIGSQGARL